MSNTKQVDDGRFTTLNIDDNVTIGGDLSVTGSLPAATSLANATATVDVSASAAPTAGQVLKATSGTVAAWSPSVVVLSYNFGVGSVDDTVFVSSGAWALMSASASYTTAEGGALTVQLNKCTGTQAPTAGTNMLQATFDLNAAVNTVQNGTLSATASDYTLAAGDRICVDFSGAVTTAAGGCVSLVLQQLA